ncbi:hypothetical protein ASG31_14460 [Chryseobacterium sp. Leaf404]|uniref:hypothetical protein n=1 Tax=unclassified Chryseobacterium TaxID=2593645 RepID=UPI0006F96DB6|nr:MULTISPECIES: hypothetical protein [unclassified Chryseobacterium]KQT15466.1 hypothetical protein ASG31_14460 [Chryseobacterium sp. Leaf404]
MKKSLFVAAIAAISLVACKKGDAATEGKDSVEETKDSTVAAIDSTKDAAVDSIKTGAEVAKDSVKATAEVAKEEVKAEAKKEEVKH